MSSVEVIKGSFRVVSSIELKMLFFINCEAVIPEGYEEVGPYRAMYDYKYREHTWGNWEDGTRILKDWDSESEPSLSKIRDIVGDPDWEEYVFSIIVKEGTSDDEVDLIIEEAGYVPDYILERNSGEVTLLHQTDYIKDLIRNGYYSTQDEIDFSFGKGLYCLDKAHFKDVKGGWAIKENVYIGLYSGEYLRCIEDVDTGGKSGDNNKYEQELLIPFNDKSIDWNI